MKVLISVKRVVDHNVRVGVLPDGSDVDIAGVKMSVNPFDENAIEAAVRLKEQGLATELVAVTFGTAAHQDVLRHALAMGVDRAILVNTDDKLQPLAVAKLLKAVVAQEQPQLVLLGKQAIDDDAAQTGPMLAGLLNWPQATFASKLDIEGQTLQVVREIEGGTEQLSLQLPAVVTADLRLNDPRFVKLPNLMMAKKKPVQTLEASSLASLAAPKLQPLKVAEPPARKPGVKLNSVAELVQHLKANEVI